MNSSKKDCCDVVKIGKKTYFRCTLCGAHRSIKNRVFSHLVDCHSLSPAKPVYKLYNRDPSVPVPKRTTSRRVLVPDQVPKAEITDENLALLSSEKETEESSQNKETFQIENFISNITEHETFCENHILIDYNENGNLLTDETESMQSLMEIGDGSESHEGSESDDNSDVLDNTDSVSSDTDYVSSDASSVNNEQCESAQCINKEKDYSLAFLSFAMNYNLAGNCIDDLILLHKSTNPQSKSWLPNNYKQLLKKTVLSGHQDNYRQHHYCMKCFKLFQLTIQMNINVKHMGVTDFNIWGRRMSS